MFQPQEYMRLIIDKDRITLTRELMGVILEEEFIFKHAPYFIRVYELFEKYKYTLAIAIQNNKESIDFFRDMIDEGTEVPAYTIISEDRIIFKLIKPSEGIRRLEKEYPNSNNLTVVLIPDIRKLLKRV